MSSKLNITSYIKELILKNECIILPGFGGFETHYQPAQTNKTKGKLMPPSKKVIFREEYKKDNGVLLQLIQSKEKITYEKAKLALDSYITELQNNLRVNGKVEIEGVGVLLKDENGKLVFKPVEAENYLIDSFGLSELNLPDVIPEAVSPTLSENTENGSWKSLYIITLLTVLITIFIIVSIKTRFIEKIVALTGITMPEEEKTVFGKMKSDTVTNGIEQVIDKSTSPKNALQYTEPKSGQIKDTIAPNKVENRYEKKYLIVAGSFIKESYAIKQSNKLKNAGYTNYIIKTRKNQFRVILNSYSDKNYAIQELNRFRADLGENIWLWTDC